MGTYGLKGVTRAWELEKLTAEQAIGQILQILAGLEERLRDLEHRQVRMDRAVASPAPAPQSPAIRDVEQET